MLLWKQRQDWVKAKAEASEMGCEGVKWHVWQYLANDVAEVTRLAIDAEN